MFGSCKHSDAVVPGLIITNKSMLIRLCWCNVAVEKHSSLAFTCCSAAAQLSHWAGRAHIMALDSALTNSYAVPAAEWDR